MDLLFRVGDVSKGSNEGKHGVILAGGFEDRGTPVDKCAIPFHLSTKVNGGVTGRRRRRLGINTDKLK